MTSPQQQPIGETPSAAGAASTASNVAALYRQIIGREPDAAGLQYWLQQLQNGAISINELSATLANSPEGRNYAATSSGQTPNSNTPVAPPAGVSGDYSHKLNDLYQSDFGRAPDAAGMAYWQNQINSGKMTLDDVNAALRASPEYHTAHPATPAAPAAPAKTAYDPKYVDAAGKPFYTDPWQMQHEGIDLGNGQTWFANPTNERSGTASLDYGFATQPGQTVANITSPGGGAADYSWLSNNVKQGVDYQGQQGFSVANDMVGGLGGSMIQTNRDNGKYADHSKGLGLLGALGLIAAAIYTGGAALGAWGGAEGAAAAAADAASGALAAGESVGAVTSSLASAGLAGSIADEIVITAAADAGISGVTAATLAAGTAAGATIANSGSGASSGSNNGQFNDSNTVTVNGTATGGSAVPAVLAGGAGIGAIANSVGDVNAMTPDNSNLGLDAATLAALAAAGGGTGAGAALAGGAGVLGTAKDVLGVGAGINTLLNGGGGGTKTGGGTGNTGSGYIPTGLSAADTTYLQTLNNQAAAQKGISDAVSPVLLDAFNKTKGINTQPMIDAGVKAGQQYGDLATLSAADSKLLQDQGSYNFGNQRNIDTAGKSIYDLGMDPQHALYDRTLQQVQEQSRAASSLRGIGTSGNAAGLENDATKNFNIDWQNNQLARANTGLSGYEGALKTGAGLGQLGSADVDAAMGYAAAVPGYTQKAASTPIQAQVDAYQLPATAASNYATGMQTDVLQGNQNLMASTIPYLNAGIGATNTAFGNNLAATGLKDQTNAAGLTLLGNGLSGLSNNSTVNGWVSNAGNWLSNLWGGSSTQPG